MNIKSLLKPKIGLCVIISLGICIIALYLYPQINLMKDKLLSLGQGFTQTQQDSNNKKQAIVVDSSSQRITTAHKITKLAAGIKITFKTAQKLTNFIEDDLRSYIKQKKYYIPKEESGLAFPIEYDSQTQLTFIHLGDHKKAYIGKGRFKIVSKSILYDRQKPVIVANCETEYNCQREAYITDFLKNLNKSRK